MEQVFLDIFNVSITAGWLILAVMLLRLLLKKIPKFFVVFMWALVGLRLVFPFSIESVWSLIPSVQTIPDNFISSESPEIQSGISFVDSVVNDGISTLMDKQETEIWNPDENINALQQIVGSNSSQNQDFVSQGEGKRNPLQKAMTIASMIWIAGVILILAYSFISWIYLHNKTKVSVKYQDNIYWCDAIDLPFVFGVFRPRIYLPSGMNNDDVPYVVKHEKAHLARRDHWWKLLGFVLLAVYWFHPLIWAAYILFCRDMELACDEKVIKDMDMDEKKGYSLALLACSESKKMILACPLAFGEVGVKERVKFMKQYKKPAFWICVVAIVVCIGLGVGFLTSPTDDSKEHEEDKEHYWVPEIKLNEYASVWKEGSYPSLVMYKNILYAPAKMPEGEIVHIQQGTIQSKVEQGIPTKNFQTNNDDLVGCTVHAWSGNYIYVLRGDEYLAYKDITADDDFFRNTISGISSMRTEMGMTKAYLQNEYLLALADSEKNYLLYLGGIENGEAKYGTGTIIVYLTEINDDITAFYDEMIGIKDKIIYKECEASKLEMDTVQNYITNFWENYVPTEDTELNELVESITSVGSGNGNRGISIGIINCTKEKIALFREKICNYKYLEFPNSDDWEETVIVDEETPDWGITFSVKKVKSTGVTLVCKQSGGAATGELTTGEPFVIHKYTDKGWVEAGDMRNVIWNSIGLLIPKNDTIEWKINWRNLYGKLPEGKYRIGRSIMDFRAAGDYDEAMFYAEFTIS